MAFLKALKANRMIFHTIFVCYEACRSLPLQIMYDGLKSNLYKKDVADEARTASASPTTSRTILLPLPFNQIHFLAGQRTSETRIQGQKSSP